MKAAASGEDGRTDEDVCVRVHSVRGWSPGVSSHGSKGGSPAIYANYVRDLRHRQLRAFGAEMQIRDSAGPRTPWAIFAGAAPGIEFRC